MTSVKTYQGSSDERLPVEVREGIKKLGEEYEKACLTNERIKSFIEDEWEREYRQRRFEEAWKPPLDFVEKIFQALDAGFDPYTPPNWLWCPLTDYYGSIPEGVMERIESALPIFGLRNIYILAPHFQPWMARDPIVVGSIELNTDLKVRFFIGAWNLEEDRRAVI